MGWSDTDSAVPVITSVESGWKICNDKTTDAARKSKHCNKDAECPGGACIAAPHWGPPGQYGMIHGAKLGTSGLVRFRLKADRKEAIGDTSFPEACGKGIWKDDSAVVKIPKEFLNRALIGQGAYEITIERSGVESAPKDFVVVNEPPGPGICRIDPSGGPVAQPVTIFGEHFIGESGRVVFSDEKEARATSDAVGTKIETIVPSGAVTGALFVERTLPDVFRSNSVNFAVGSCKANTLKCGAGEQCCANGSCREKCVEPVASHYAYLFSTGPIPKAPRVLVSCKRGVIVSPSPWNGWSKSGTVCIDAVVTAEFGPADIEIDMQSVRDHLTVEKCTTTAAGADPCKTTDPVTDGSVSGTGARAFTWGFFYPAAAF